MVVNEEKPINPINTCTLSPIVVALIKIPSKVIKKSRETICRRELETIKRAQ